MDFFDKIGKKASEAYKVTADKTGKIAKETKMKLKITELKSQVNDIYEEIGKIVYEKHILKEKSIEKEIEEKCTKIDVLSDEIDSLLKQCLDLKDKKQCKKCYTEIEKEMKFCPNCGEKQPEEHINNEDEDTKNSESTNSNGEQEKENEEKINKEAVQESKQEEKRNIQKTIAIESNIEIDEDQIENEKDNNEENLE